MFTVADAGVDSSLRGQLTAERPDELDVQSMGRLIRYDVASRQAPVASSSQQRYISLRNMQASQPLMPSERLQVLRELHSPGAYQDVEQLVSNRLVVKEPH